MDRHPTGSGLVDQIVDRASSRDYEKWWSQVGHAGYCAAPVHLRGRDEHGKHLTILTRCKNRRAIVCPSCSSLYSGDTWQLVHRGITPHSSDLGSDDATGSAHAMAFATLTAPSFGLVHTAGREPASVCHPGRADDLCAHGRPRTCGQNHRPGDPQLGEPLCPDCYDYPAHVLFTWHAPALWHRFTIGLRRLVRRRLRDLGQDAGSIRVSYVKIVELQRRGVPHFHAVVRLDPKDETSAPEAAISSVDLAALIHRAVAMTALDVPSIGGELVTLRFGAQTDVQPMRVSAASGAADEDRMDRRVAGYLAKYVTKSVDEFGLSPRRLSPLAIESLDLRPHIRAILWTILDIAESLGHGQMLRWLHTLGYRGHITTKTRDYSTTMTALRAQRAAWRSLQDEGDESNENETPTVWEFVGSGHANDGERLLASTAAAKVRETRQTARDELSCLGDDDVV